MQHWFYTLADEITARLRGDEQFTCWLSAEASDFVRFNRGLIRQSGHVQQRYLTLKLISGQRQAQGELTLSGARDEDTALVARLIDTLRTQLPDLPDDPYLLVSTEVQSSERIVASALPPTQDIVDEVLSVAAGHDFVGILASGPVYRGFANSLGQRNWHEVASFNLDWSLYHAADKAVKSGYAGFRWDGAAFRDKFAEAARQLVLLQRPAVSIAPGPSRVFLTPTALAEIIGMLNWGGVSEKSLRTKQSSLRRMRDEGLTLNNGVSLFENTADGLAPSFQAEGFIKPPRVNLIERGQLVGSLISPRTAREYGLVTNGDESLASIEVAAGTLPQAEALSALDTGVWISNLWYLNYSDRASCRMTGMTRFASFRVENGEIVAPLNVMRFDESLYRMLGDNLMALTRERELLIDGMSYGQRGTDSALLPGALVEDFRFVL
ncbi:TldD/PmbA family protein [Viridibacterium curvum]|uniref:TldD/PmbA family protein n=1 Tax=Viridibacterium curvum TaxID=1101404 RepID=A0ABP9QSH3_9RHOO